MTASFNGFIFTVYSHYVICSYAIRYSTRSMMGTWLYMYIYI